MRIAVEKRAEEALIRLFGDLDLASVPQVKAQVTELLDEGIRSFLFDLSDVEHVDTTGLGFFVWVRKHCVENQGVLQLAGHNPHFRKLLHLTGLSEIFHLVDDTDSAWAELGQAPR